MAGAIEATQREGPKHHVLTVRQLGSDGPLGRGHGDFATAIGDWKRLGIGVDIHGRHAADGGNGGIQMGFLGVLDEGGYTSDGVNVTTLGVYAEGVGNGFTIQHLIAVGIEGVVAGNSHGEGWAGAYEWVIFYGP